MALRFIDYDDVIFGKAPLLAVLCQIRFKPVYSLMAEVAIAGFHESLRMEYPELTVTRSTEIAMGNPVQLGFSQHAPIWNLSDKEGNWKVSLSADFVALETPSYNHFGEFIDRLRSILNVVDRTVHPGESTRIGLRKINLIEHPKEMQPTDWSALLRQELLGFYTLPHPGEIDVQWSDTRISEGHEQLAVRYGFARRNTIKQLSASLLGNNGQPVPNQAPGGNESNSENSDDNPTAFFLDLDYSSLSPLPVSGSDEVCKLLRGYSDSITSFFHWGITDKYKEWLNPLLRSNREES